MDDSWSALSGQPDGTDRTGGRRRAADPADAVSRPGSTGGRRHAAEDAVGGGVAPRPGGTGGRRRAAEPGDGEWPAGEPPSWAVAGAVPQPRANGSRHAAPDHRDPSPRGRHGVAEQPSGAPTSDPRAPAWPTPGGRRRAPDTAAPEPAAGSPRGGVPTDAASAGSGWAGAPAPGSAAGSSWAGAAAGSGWGGAAAEGTAWVGRERPGHPRRAPAVGLPGWLGPSATPGAPDVPVGASRVADPQAWRRPLVAVVRVEWLLGVVCFVGLAYPRTAPYTAGLLAGALVVAGAYGRLRWQSAPTRRPPEPDRIPTYAAVTAVATALVIIPAAMVGALTLARLAAVAAVTSATAASVLLARSGDRGIPP